MAEYALQAIAHLGDLQQLLLLGDLQIEMAGNGVSQLRRLLDLVQRNQDLRRDLLVQLDVLLELRDDRPAERFQFLGVGTLVGHRLGERFEVGVGLLEAGDLRTPATLDQHLHGAVRQLQKLQDRRYRPDAINVIGGRIILRGILLRHQEDLLVLLHHRFQRADRLLAAHEQRDDHMGEYNNIAERQDGEQIARRGSRGSRQWFLGAPFRFRGWPIGISHG